MCCPLSINKSNDGKAEKEKRFFGNFGDFWLKSVPRGPKHSDKKSRDFSFKNPGILADLKSRDPGIPGIPLGPDEELMKS